MSKKLRTSKLPVPRSFNGHQKSNKSVWKEVPGQSDKASETESCCSARELQALLDREKENNRKLKEQLLSQEHQIKYLEKELSQNLEKSGSSSVLALSEELFAKDAVIRDLEELHKKVLEYNRDIFRLLSAVFSTCGLSVSEEEMQVSLTTGRVHFISDLLVSALEERRGRTTSDAWSQIDPDDIRQDVSSRPSAESLIKVVPNLTDDTDEDLTEEEAQWDSKRFNGASENDVSGVQYIEFSNSLQKDWKNEDIMDLFNVLERNRRSLLRLEHKMQDMEKYEKMQSSVKNNERIRLLETILSHSFNEESSSEK